MKQKINDPFNESDDSEYEYYKYGDIPIRVVYGQETDIAISAHVFNVETQVFEAKVSFISKALDDPHSDEIKKEEFYRLCERLMQNKV